MKQGDDQVMFVLGELLDQALQEARDVQSVGELGTAVQKTATLLGRYRHAAGRQHMIVPADVLEAVAALHRWSIELHGQALRS